MLSIYNKVSDYIIIVDITGKIVFCNKSFLKKVNYDNDELLNTNIMTLIKNKENFIENILKEFKETNQILRFYSKTNKEINVEASISKEKYNNENHIFIIGKEVRSERYTKEILEALLDNINSAAFIMDKDGTYLYANKEYAKVLNNKKENIINRSIYNYYEDEKIHRKFEKHNNEVFESGKPQTFNEKLVHKGKTYYYESYKAPIYDEAGNPKYIAATTKSISLDQVISDELYKNYNILGNKNINYNHRDNLNLKQILTNIGKQIIDDTQADGLGIYMYDEDRKGLYQIVRLQDTIYNLKGSDLISIENPEYYLDLYKDYFNKLFYIDELKGFLKKDQLDSDRLSYFGTYTLSLYNEFIGFIVLIYNKTEPSFNCDEYMKYICNKIAMVIKNIKLTNEVFIENKKRIYIENELEEYLNISVDLISLLDENGFIKKVNDNWLKVLGWRKKEILYMNIYDIIHPEEINEFRKLQLTSNLNDKNNRGIIRCRHKDGSYVYLEWSLKYIANQKIYITTARDITKTLEMEKERLKLEEAFQLEIVKNEFFSNISHEFRTPINIILGTTQLINRKIEKNNIDLNSLSTYVKYIKQNSYRLLKLVNNLIDMTKMDIGMYDLRCSNQDIISVIEDITLSVVAYTKDKKIDLIFDTDEEEVITYFDPDKIERIMLNLLSNAIKYTPKGGCINVKIVTEDDKILVHVKDNGVGISKDKIGIVFTRFKQADSLLNRSCEGSGIGLSIVKNLVEMHGGNISVSSEVNVGTEFIFTIPIQQKKSNICIFDIDRKSKHVERCDIEFSDIYN